MSPALPLTAGFVFLLIAGYFEWKTYRVPNKLTYSAIGLALIFSVIASSIAPEKAGTLPSAIVGMLLGGAILLPFYVNGILGAGCVKAQAACGAWIGAGFQMGACVKFVLVSTFVAMIVAVICYQIADMMQKMNSKQVDLSLDNNQSIENTPHNNPSLVHGQLPLSIGTMLGVILAAFLF